MSRRIKVVVLEDNPADAELMLRELERAGYAPDARRVDAERDFSAALGPDVDLALVDYTLPDFDGRRALRLVRDRGLDAAVLIVSGSIGEELAVALMVEGASAVVMKSRLETLGPIARRALQETEARRESRSAHLLLAAEVELRKAIEESMRAGLETFGPDGAILHVNQFFCDLVGRPREELVGAKPPFPYWPDAERAELRARFDEDLRGVRRAAGFDARFVRPDGSAVDVIVDSAPLVGEGGRSLGCVRVVHDVTERNRLQERVLHAQKMETVGILAGGVAHDFNNILASILANCSFVLNSLAPDDPRRADVLEIRAAGERAAVLTRQLLIFSRRQPAQSATFDLNESIAGVVKMIRRLLGEDIRVETSFAREAAWVRGDPVQLEQAIVNLATNARDAMPRGGVLSMRVSAAGGRVRLEVRDTGAGMTPEARAHLFEPFFTTKASGRGTGLGLSTVYGIVKQSDGTIAVESELGKGTLVAIEFPLAPPEAAARPAAARPAAADAAAAGTILVVEDDDAVRRVETRLLEQKGHSVVPARSGEEALRLFQEAKTPIDLVVTDVVMPGISGVELARRIHDSRPEVPFLFLTGYASHEELRRLEGLPWEMLQKPVATETFLAKVGACVAAARAAAAAR